MNHGLFVGRGQPPPYQYAGPPLANWHAHGGAPGFGGGGKPQVMQVHQHVSAEPDIENFDDFVNLPIALSKRIKELQKRARARYGTIQTLEAENKELEDAKRRLEAVVQGSKKEISQKSEEIKYYMSEGYRQTIQEPLNKEILSLRNNLATTQEELGGLDQRIAQLSKTIEALRSENKRLSDTNQKCNTQIGSLRNENSSLSQQLQRIKSELEALDAQHTEHQGRHADALRRLQGSIQFSDYDKRHFRELLSTYWNSQSGANSFHVKADLMSFLVEFAHKHISTPAAASNPPQRPPPSAPRPRSTTSTNAAT
jgi:predicted nuclease with TOPRIM domain